MGWISECDWIYQTKFDFNSDVVRGQLTPVMMETLKNLLQDGVILDYLANALAPRIQLRTQVEP